MFLQDQFQSDNVTDDLNSDEAGAHAVTSLKGLGAGSNRCSIIVVNVHAIAAANRSGIVIVIQILNTIDNLLRVYLRSQKC